MIPFYKGNLGNFINESLEDIVSSGMATNYGKYFNQLKNRIEEYLCPRKVMLVASGTHALTMSLLALKNAHVIPEQNARILVPSFTFVASAQAILLAGMEPVFADIDLETWTINMEDANGPAAYGAFDAVMPVNIFGVQPAIPEDIPVVADLSHGFGGSLNGKKNGTTGTVCAFSCSITKPFHTIEGGIIASEDNEIIKDVTSMARWCLTEDYNCTGAGQWSKLSEVHAVAGLESLKTLEQAIQHKNLIAKQYKEVFDALPIEYQKIPDGCETTRKDFAILVPAKIREKITTAFKANEIGYKLYFSPAIHETDYFKANFPRYHLPITEEIASRIICLPIHQNISEDDIGYIGNVVRRCF